MTQTLKQCNNKKVIFYKFGSLVNKLIIYLILMLIVFIVFIPLSTLVLAAFKTPMEISNWHPFELPKGLNFQNFINAFNEGKMGLAFKNSILLSFFTVLLNILLGTMTSYILVRHNFRGKTIIMLLFLFAMVLPFYTTEIARFSIIQKMGLYNTMFAPLIIYVGTDMMQIYIYAQYIEKIPYVLEEAAMMEGASSFIIFNKVIFPLLLPASATLGIIKFIEVINDMYIPYLYMPSSKLKTLSTALMTFAGQRNMNWGKLSAAIIIVMLPTLLIYLVFQKAIISGISRGAVKE